MSYRGERNRPIVLTVQPNNSQNKCAVILKAIKWIPVVFITAVLCWSYYAYIVQLCFFTVDTHLERVILLCLYHIFFIFFLWSYYRTILTPVRTVPYNFRIPLADLDRLSKSTSEEQQKQILDTVAQDLPVINRTITGAVRYCEKCQHIKPDRAHHCSVCGVCVLKMDHHCPWINNCVNFSNYKFFVLFLGYALFYCLYVALSSLRYFLRFWRGELDGGPGRFHIVFLFFVAAMFSASLVSLFVYHIYLVLKNRTTLESFRAPVFLGVGADKNGFNLGKYNNFQEVFGDRKRLWFLPLSTSLSDGILYNTRPDMLLPADGDHRASGVILNRADGHLPNMVYPIQKPDVRINMPPLMGDSGMGGGGVGVGVGSTQETLSLTKRSSSVISLPMVEDPRV